VEWITWNLRLDGRELIGVSGTGNIVALYKGIKVMEV
jgi:hypothetical protein